MRKDSKSTYGYAFHIDNSVHGADTETFIRNALQNEHIIKWAFIFHDKDAYTEHDINVRKYGCYRNWAEGFNGMEKYASVEEYVAASLKKPPFIGDLFEAKWDIVCITDSSCDLEKIVDLFHVPKGAIRTLKDTLYIADALKNLTREDDMSRSFDRHLYSDEEVISNFDFRKYIVNSKRNERFVAMKRGFDPAMLASLLIMLFFIVCVIKLATTLNSWITFCIVGGIGVMYLVLNMFAIINSKKQNRHISGIPFIGGIHLLIAGLLSPCKWLAMTFLLDYSFLSFLYSWFKKDNVIDGEERKSEK